MNELRSTDGMWGISFEFNLYRLAILFVDGDKSDGREKRFYKSLIAGAVDRFDCLPERRKG
ncbi:hypothetical protein [Sedimentitalea arenosa]|uniref:Uncharacterized protein n=1 Tax=Sedimentitalea arenosa TaxID=2798803 RepID=A0A8J7JC30_9RHOB|nr:hypothetical protein [Arenibacterium arenosum]MBJ6373118.1 hypothetical protein [Arenibacterium arenosum]